MRFLSQSITRKIMAISIVVAVIPIALIGFIAHTKIKPTIEKQVFDKLLAIGELKKKYLQEYFIERKADIVSLSRQKDIVEATENFGKLLQKYKGSHATALAKYQKQYGDIHLFLQDYILNHGWNNIYLIDTAEGYVIDSSNPELKLSSQLDGLSERGKAIVQIWREIRQNRKPGMKDLSSARIRDLPVFLVAAPVFGRNGNLNAILAVELNFNQINRIMEDATGLGKTGDSYLVGQDFLLRSQSRLYNKSVTLSEKISNPALYLAFQDSTGIMTLKNNDGNEALVYFSHLGLDKLFGSRFDWAIITQMDAREALAFARKLNLGCIILSILIVVLVFSAGIYVAGTIAHPITNLSRQVEKIAAGDLEVDIHTNGRVDEIGSLNRSFAQMVSSIRTRVDQFEKIAEGNLETRTTLVSERDEMGRAICDMMATLRNVADYADRISKGDLTVDIQKHSNHDTLGSALSEMVQKLRKQIKDISESVDVLISSTDKILSSTAELAASAQETASAVSETTTTAEEIRQTVHMTNQKIQELSQTSQDANEISQEGKAATHESIKKILKIKEQMEMIAESILQLNEQSQKIGEIISSVEDIAEQSNLLSVNASIEAAKAGEHGKGFAVVAQEIKNLADQSKQATMQVKSLLDDIQKATAAAVMATEQGSKAVETGVEKAMKSGEAIDNIADTVAKATEAFVQIAASNQQQLAGIDQVTMAMESIKEATAQNAETAKELEESAISLKELGARLENLVHNYKT